jgi:4-hydroxy 2-oxovalerate aldolase
MEIIKKDYIKNTDVKVLDCTIRDGGYVNNWNFTDEQVHECYIACQKSKVDYMEIGFRNIKKKELLDKYGDSFFCDEKYINNIIGNNDTYELYNHRCKICVMVTINAFDINDFIEKKNSKIDMIRVLMAYHGLNKGNDEILNTEQLLDGIRQINQLIELGYDVSFNIGRIDKLNYEQLDELCKNISSTKIKYFTIADTYGSVDHDYIEVIIPYIVSLFNKYNSNIEVGFHAHDNMCNATSKTLYSIKYGVNIIDGCMLGYGRGSGNAKTELLLMDLNKNYNRNNEFIYVIDYADKYLFSYKECVHQSSYNIIYILTSYFGCHVSYAIDIIEKYEKINIIDIYNKFKKIKEEGKNMFYYDGLFLKI